MNTFTAKRAANLFLTSTLLASSVLLGAGTLPSSASAATVPIASARSLPAVVPSGTVTFNTTVKQKYVKLPVYAVQVRYGVDEDPAPAVQPKAPLPAVSFAIPSGLENQLAVYWMNLGYDSRGAMFLAPKGWIAAEALVGANGSYGITLRNPANTAESLTFSDTAGSCVGCAISSIGSYFPKERTWADEEGFPGEPKTYQQYTMLGENALYYSLKDSNNSYTTKGVAVKTSRTDDILFRRQQVRMTRDHQLLSYVMLDFFTDRYRTGYAKSTSTADKISAELELLVWYQQEPASTSRVTPLIRKLPDIDWGKLSRLSGTSRLWPEEMINDLTRHISVITPDLYLPLLKSTKGLDGALSESYSNLIGTLFDQQPVKVIQVLSRADRSLQTSAVHLIGYHLSYRNTAGVIQELQLLRQQKSMDANAQKVIDLLIQRVKSPY
ncbi:DUF4850 domain-containing protein [Paenibacillus sp. JX-17]|uniref:DUF4850 domain-containing protein n=1 Tax=Paenibacillus lacisoli TaxID=3064525 RepID=A0ABT9CJ59_9BACL|nr:DUF4850 domain-containing protein [Paenibacillus sp. JX-17]MDO7907648.1 DUF4850 domain-containing protein [Paenibacillus sp. JX-17]